MGGASKGGGSLSTSGPSPQQEATTKFFRESVAEPLGNTLIPQILEALQTGGVGARIPIAQRAVEQSRAATSRALTDTETSLSRAGQARTPFGERTRAATRLAGESTIAGIPIEIAQALMAIAPQLLTGSGTIAIGGPGVSSSKATGPSPNVFGDIIKAGADIGAAWMGMPPIVP